MCQKKVALLSQLDNDRALLITETEEETPDDSSISVEYQMLWQVLGKTVTDERSHQEESISALLQGERIATRFTERGSSTIPPDQLGHSLSDHDTPLSVFGKQSSSLVYEAVNLAILVILKEYLKQHAHLDTCPAEFGTEEGFILDEDSFDTTDAS